MRVSRQASRRRSPQLACPRLACRRRPAACGPSACPHQHRNEHVLQRRRNGSHGSAAAGRRRRRVLPTCSASRSGHRRDEVDAVAEQADRRGGKLLPQDGGGPAGLGGADLQDRAPHQLLDFVRRAAGQQPALMDQGQAIAALGLVEIGRGDEDRHLLAQQLVEDPPEVAARDGIDAVGRLVQEQHPRRVDQRAGQAELLLHAAGEVARQAAFEGRQVAEGQQPLDPLVAALAGHVVDVGVEVEVLHHGQVGVEPEPLAHVADFVLDRLGLADDVMAGHPGLAAVGVHDRRSAAAWSSSCRRRRARRGRRSRLPRRPARGRRSPRGRRTSS